MVSCVTELSLDAILSQKQFFYYTFFYLFCGLRINRQQCQNTYARSTEDSVDECFLMCCVVEPIFVDSSKRREICSHMTEKRLYVILIIILISVEVFWIVKHLLTYMVKYILNMYGALYVFHQYYVNIAREESHVVSASTHISLLLLLI